MWFLLGVGWFLFFGLYVIQFNCSVLINLDVLIIALFYWFE